MSILSIALEESLSIAFEESAPADLDYLEEQGGTFTFDEEKFLLTLPVGWRVETIYVFSLLVDDQDRPRATLSRVPGNEELVLTSVLRGTEHYTLEESSKNSCTGSSVCFYVDGPGIRLGEKLTGCHSGEYGVARRAALWDAWLLIMSIYQG